MKKQNLFISVLFCLFLAVMPLLTLLLPHKSFSEQENRNLAAPPRLSEQSLRSGRFMEDAEDWVSDHMVLRDQWVRLKALAERLSGKRENNDVYFCAGDTLIKRVDKQDKVSKAERARSLHLIGRTLEVQPWQIIPYSSETGEGRKELLTVMEKALREDKGFSALLRAGVPVRFALIPTAASVWADRLPANAPTADETAWISRLSAQTDCGGPDVAGALQAHRDEELYYRTDHHWTSLGARYDAILADCGLPLLREEELRPRVVSESFYGTVYSRAGAWWVKPDRITTLVPEDGIRVISNFTGTETAGSLYVPSRLEEKNKYAFFLGGNQPVCVVQSPAAGPKLLLIRDSYSDSLVPLLSLRFSEIHLLDLRYYRLSPTEYIEAHGLDEALVLYSLPTFLEDRNLILLKR